MDGFVNQGLEVARKCSKCTMEDRKQCLLNNRQHSGRGILSHTVHVKYNGPIPEHNPPKWMTEVYLLCTQNAHKVVLQLLPMIRRVIGSPRKRATTHELPYFSFPAQRKIVLGRIALGHIRVEMSPESSTTTQSPWETTPRGSWPGNEDVGPSHPRSG